MAIGDINPGYTGYALINTQKTRFSSASISDKQAVTTPDLIMGHWDRNAYHFGQVEVSGSMNGPVTENFVGSTSSIWEWATNRSGTCGSLSTNPVTLYYYCDAGVGEGKGKSFGNMLVNNLTFSCAAGDVAQFSLDVMGASKPEWVGGAPDNYVDEEKLVTWDEIGVTITAGDISIGTLDTSAFSNFSITIANNLNAVYAIHSEANYYPYDIVPGLRSITGSLSVFNIPKVSGVDKYNETYDGNTWAANGQGTLDFSIAGESYSIKCRFNRVEPESSVNEIISTVAFTGVGVQTSLDS